jgi:hypothetical protein
MHRTQQIKYEACSKKKTKTKTTSPGMPLEENSHTVHSPAGTARADADHSRRGCWIPGIPPCWRGSSFSKQPPPSQPLSLEGSKPSMKPGARGQGPDPRPDAPIRSARCFWVEWHDSARLAHENWSKGMPCRPPSAIRHSPSVRSSAPYAYCVLTGAAGPSGP